ncbi:MAG: hypothetical protein WC718_04775 [Phycisphaerales bacterium]|jgi:hypothetical protein
MKLFWSFVAIAVLLCGGYLTVAAVRSTDATPPDATPAAATTVDDALTSAAKPAAPVLAPKADAKAATTEVQASAAAPALAPSPLPAAAPAPATTAVTASASVAPLAKAPPAVAPSPAAPGAAAPELAEGVDALVSEMPDKIDGFEVIPAMIEHTDDGMVILDGRYKLKGEGTKESPYDITWEMLTSAQQTFDPKSGKKKIPGAVAFVHRKFVHIRGYVAFPLQIKEPRELLSMLNQWDGCCIGVPPTPYDAVEVNLLKSVSGNARFATAGGITGKFLVKPYVTGDWLVGLYVINQGSLDSTDFGGSGSTPAAPKGNSADRGY